MLGSKNNFTIGSNVLVNKKVSNALKAPGMQIKKIFET